jgi:biotin carboxyl carrier protein
MKFTVKNPHDAGSFVIDIPDSVVARPPAPGERFVVLVTPEGAPAEALEAAFIGDGESLLLGTRVVRLPTRFVTGKRGIHRFRLGEVATARSLLVTPVRPVEPKKSAASLGGGPLKSPMTGKVLAVNVADGALVKEGEVLVVIEAMKMENRIIAECDGKVKGVLAKPGTAVTTGEVLLTVEPSGV